jgi:hypothetical protein
MSRSRTKETSLSATQNALKPFYFYLLDVHKKFLNRFAKLEL